MTATWRPFFVDLVYIGFRGLRVYWHCPFSCETKNKATEAILVLSILINRSYFQLNALELGIYGFLGSASLLALSVFMCDLNRGYSGHLEFINYLRLLA